MQGWLHGGRCFTFDLKDAIFAIPDSRGHGMPDFLRPIKSAFMTQATAQIC